MSAESRAQFAEAARRDPVDLGLACVLVGAEVDQALDPPAEIARLDALAAAVRPRLAGARAPVEALQAGLSDFSGSGEDYGDVRSSLLPQVLRRRRGLPILLSVVWLEVARRLAVPAHGIGLPGHFVVSVDGVAVDPFAAGATLSPAALADRVRRATGQPLTPDDLAPVPATAILLRVLTNIRSLAARTLDPRMQLWAVELALLLPDAPPALRRERGELLGRLGEFAAGAAELMAYADAVAPADPAAAELARRAARMAESRLN